jgi:hypothetical protein
VVVRRSLSYGDTEELHAAQARLALASYRLDHDLNKASTLRKLFKGSLSTNHEQHKSLMQETVRDSLG